MRTRWKRSGAQAPTPAVFRWDLDKTYLKSEFDSLRELVRIPFEKAEDKIAAPGVVALIRALRESALASGRDPRTYFISASPPQIGRAIREKLDLDGIVYDGIVFKDQLQRLIRGKFRHLREQVGFKLTELLKARLRDAAAAQECLFGDDWESDPLIYSLYADVLAGRVSEDELGEVLQAIRVDPPLVREACALAGRVERAEAVTCIFIALERRTPLARFRCFGSRLIPTFNYFQTAACLYDQGVLDRAGVAAVARSLVTESAYSKRRLANSLADLQRRGHLREASASALRRYLRRRQLLAVPGQGAAESWWAWIKRVPAAVWPHEPVRRLAAPSAIDYRDVVAQRRAAESSSG
ncbi:MAG: hypothetical protein A3J75_03135 [Acidobacteria bacterium RBG_16_68_9]|nr:MAG: hypothetical protein A3J75_03135 [Acidobacteria bacterium RBG_16_68_9]